MTRYIGLDVHNRFIEYCILDAAGKKLTRGQTPCVRSSLEAFATKILQPTDHVALAASTNTWSVVAILRPHVAQLVVGNRNIAIVASARKLVTIAFLMLKHQEPYRYAKPELMRKKFRELHYTATGERLPAQRTKRPRGLADVYRALGLPDVAVSTALPKGERAMLEKRKLTAWVDELHDADRRVPPTKPTSKAKSVGRA